MPTVNLNNLLNQNCNINLCHYGSPLTQEIEMKPSAPTSIGTSERLSPASSMPSLISQSNSSDSESRFGDISSDSISEPDQISGDDMKFAKPQENYNPLPTLKVRIPLIATIQDAKKQKTKKKTSTSRSTGSSHSNNSSHDNAPQVQKDISPHLLYAYQPTPPDSDTGTPPPIIQNTDSSNHLAQNHNVNGIPNEPENAINGKLHYPYR